MPESPAIRRCAGCGTELSPVLLSCPGCQRLVHADELKRQADTAEEASRTGDLSAALTAWRRVLELLPPATRQHQIVTAKVAELSTALERAPARGGEVNVKPADEAVAQPAPGPVVVKPRRRGAVAAALTTIGLLLWKLKFALGVALTKGKLLLLGLTKASTFFSMILSLGVYWTAWGWKFALGLVLSIYIHEMGHVAALRHYGIKASAPMFIPGFGAVIRMKQYPANPREDARVGLAGPLWGLAAAVAAYAVYLATGWTSWAAIAKVGAWINLFNLLPVWQLDGSRGFHALSRGQRWLAAAVVGVAWFGTAEGLLALLFVVALLRALGGKSADPPDRTALIQYAFLTVTLAALAQLPIGVPAR
jgi:Zn-dependent protease